MKTTEFFSKLCEESPSEFSATRFIMIVGTLMTLTAFLIIWILSFAFKRTMPEVPPSVGMTVGSYITAFLAAKVVQKATGEQPPKAP